ncbi:MAG TPA: hypothetical protein VEO56_10625 [Bacteroidota bacterium]|nr:hypothetical protein [Bacteroidota bacterium]
MNVTEDSAILPPDMKTSPRTRQVRPPVGLDELPLFCDNHCVHASFSPPDAVGACRKEVGVYCTILGAYRAKNNPCLVRKRLAGKRGGPYRGRR